MYRSNKRNIVLATGLACVLAAPNASAYLDPGTGSMILQAVVGGIAVAGVTIRHYWQAILAFFGKRPTSNILDEDENAEN
ncbi:MAG: hypothetical protein AAGB02_00935 [Pseudomonadota bacterium]